MEDGDGRAGVVGPLRRPPVLHHPGRPLLQGLLDHGCGGGGDPLARGEGGGGHAADAVGPERPGDAVADAGEGRQAAQGDRGHDGDGEDGGDGGLQEERRKSGKGPLNCERRMRENTHLKLPVPEGPRRLQLRAGGGDDAAGVVDGGAGGEETRGL